MNTQFNSNVIWLQLEYKISTLDSFHYSRITMGHIKLELYLWSLSVFNLINMSLIEKRAWKSLREQEEVMKI